MIGTLVLLVQGPKYQLNAACQNFTKYSCNYHGCDHENSNGFFVIIYLYHTGDAQKISSLLYEHSEYQNGPL